MATARDWERHSATDTRRSSVARAPARSGPPSAAPSHRRVAGPMRPYASHTNGVKALHVRRPHTAVTIAEVF